MANDIYIITPTDGNLSREFNVSPYSTNGTVSPTSSVLDSSAVAVNTSLLFHGKGSDEYGERFQENFYHLLESFSGYNEPQFPVQGQMWFDNSDNTLKIFKAPALDIFDIDGGSLVIKLNGNPDSRYFQMVKDAIKLRFSGGFKFNIFTASTYNVIDTYIANSCVDTPITYTVPGGADLRHFLSLTLNTVSNILLPTSPGITPILSQIGLWIPVYKTSTDILETALGATLTAADSNIYAQLNHLNVAENRIINVADPIDPLDAVNKQFTAGQYLPLIGGTISGNLIVGGTLTVQGSTTFNDTINVVNSTILLDSGSRITGLVDPGSLNPLDAMNLQYADANYLNKLVADTVSGILTLSAQPGQNAIPGIPDPTHASTVGYVNDTITALGSGPTTLDGLLDVTLIAPAINEIMEYDGSQWVNVPNTGAGFVATDFISTLTGGTVSGAGILKLDGQPGQNGNAGSPFSNEAVTVGHLNTTINDQFTSVLPNGDIYVVAGSYNGPGDILSLQRTGGQPDVLINGIGASITATTVDSTLVPHTIVPVLADLGDFLESAVADTTNWPDINVALSLEALSKSAKNIQRKNGSAIFTSDGRAGPYDLDAFSNERYLGGYNSLQIYINGLKQIASTRAYIDLFRTTLNDIYPSVATGLADDPTVYTFNINVDGGGNQLISVTGSDAQIYATLKIEINDQLSNARCVIHEGGLSFITDSSGSSSTITVSDVNLFSTLSGTAVFDPTVPGVNYDYEEVGPYGYNDNTVVQFTSVIPNGNIMEFVILTVGGSANNFGYEV